MTIKQILSRKNEQTLQSHAKGYLRDKITVLIGESVISNRWKQDKKIEKKYCWIEYPIPLKLKEDNMLYVLFWNKAVIYSVEMPLVKLLVIKVALPK